MPQKGKNCQWRRYCSHCGNGKPPNGGRVVLELLQKSIAKSKNGNYIVEVEASNENLDLEGQRVLQSALLRSKDYFLHNGVISKDHRHKENDRSGNTVYREDFVIGEPLSVRVDGGSVIVKLELYGGNKYAQDFVKLLRNNSSRVKASVGGSILEKEEGERGERIKTVLWDDLALTIAPVNPTLSGAYFAKSLSSADLVKTLTAGYGTDSAEFAGGRALQGGKYEPVMIDLIECFRKGLIANQKNVISIFRKNNIIEKKYQRAVLEEIAGLVK